MWFTVCEHDLSREELVRANTGEEGAFSLSPWNFDDSQKMSQILLCL